MFCMLKHLAPIRSRSLVALLLIAAAGGSLTGCYYLQAAAGQLALTAGSRPIERLIADPATPEKLRERLAYVLEVRSFAVSELGLPDNDSYRSYVTLDRPFVIWNVFATDRYSVVPRTWCFPVAGCVVYRGYFDWQAAERAALRIRMRGGDAMVAGAAAYSTLGHFDDPVLSTMMRWSDSQLAATLFHELAHQVIYVPDDAAFNEAFATVVEEAGLERWLTARGREAELDAWRRSRLQDEEFTQLLLATRRRLAGLYATERGEEALRTGKQRILGELKYQYGLLRDTWDGYAAYDAWFERALNNAHFVPFATYHQCMPGFVRLFADAGGDFTEFYAAVNRVAALPATQRSAQLCGEDGARVSQRAADRSARSR